MNLTAEQMRTIATALDELTQITKRLEVSFTPQSRLGLGLADNVLMVSWDGNAYVIDDRNGD